MAAVDDVVVRPLRDDDVATCIEVQNDSFGDYDDRFGEEREPVTEESTDRQRRRLRHFLRHDADGAWVAERRDRVVGVALASQRDNLWGLSLLAVTPAAQSLGIGGRLLDATLGYMRPDDIGVILSSRDARAMHRYAAAGFDLHPQVRAHGNVDSRWLRRPEVPVREGAADRELLDRLDAEVRGARRGVDHEMLSSFAEAFVADAGYAYVRPVGRLETIVALDEPTATALLWRCLERAHERGVGIDVGHVNGGQQWAVRVFAQARVPMEPGGPVFWKGRTPPACYLPTGAYL